MREEIVQRQEAHRETEPIKACGFSQYGEFHRGQRGKGMAKLHKRNLCDSSAQGNSAAI